MAPVLELGRRLGPLVIIGLQEPETRRLKSFFLNQLSVLYPEGFAMTQVQREDTFPTPEITYG